jgi:hypothetical protein
MLVRITKRWMVTDIPKDPESEEMSIPARIMPVADIFEVLTGL